ncbi:MAG: hypothetical protein K9L62_10660 [Vallitaleaceae bacterium]|nr:hypothetical protein [Vallitaleaceae bacterium]
MRKAQVINGVVKTGDEVKIVGNIPKDPVVNYVSRMGIILNDEKIYTIAQIDMNIRVNRPIIQVAGWNWDARNIEKVGNVVNFKKSEEVLFPCDMLDI